MRAGDYGLTVGYRVWQRIVALVCLAAASYAAVTLLLVVVGFTVSGPVLVFLLYPAADLTLAVMAVIPLICGHRVIGSMLLVTAFFAAAASDIGYVMLRAEPSTDTIPAPTALGYLAFAIVITIYAIIAQPLPEPPRPAIRRWIPSVAVTTILDIATAGCALTAVGCGLVILWANPDTVLAVLATAVVALAAGALATTTAFTALAPSGEIRPDRDPPPRRDSGNCPRSRYSTRRYRGRRSRRLRSYNDGRSTAIILTHAETVAASQIGAGTVRTAGITGRTSVRRAGGMAGGICTARAHAAAAVVALCSG